MKENLYARPRVSLFKEGTYSGEVSPIRDGAGKVKKMRWSDVKRMLLQELLEGNLVNVEEFTYRTGIRRVDMHEMVYDLRRKGHLILNKKGIGYSIVGKSLDPIYSLFKAHFDKFLYDLMQHLKG